MERHGYGIARMRLVQPSGWWCVLLFFFSLLSLLLSALIPLTDWNRSLLSSACCFPWYLAASQRTPRFASTRPFFLQLVPRSRTHGSVLRFVSFRLWISASPLNNCPPRGRRDARLRTRGHPPLRGDSEMHREMHAM